MQSDIAAVSYRGPVDCTAIARDSRLVFVKNYIALSTYHGYKYAGWCGVDVWNLSTGHCRPLLTFDRYGRLDQLEVYTLCLKKVPTFKHSVTLSNLNRFSKIFALLESVWNLLKNL